MGTGVLELLGGEVENRCVRSGPGPGTNSDYNPKPAVSSCACAADFPPNNYFKLQCDRAPYPCILQLAAGRLVKLGSKFTNSSLAVERRCKMLRGEACAGVRRLRALSGHLRSATTAAGKCKNDMNDKLPGPSNVL